MIILVEFLKTAAQGFKFTHLPKTRTGGDRATMGSEVYTYWHVTVY